MANPRPSVKSKSTYSQAEALMPYVDQLIANYYAFLARATELQGAPVGARDD